MKSLAIALGLLALAPAVGATPVTLEFEEELELLPYSEKGFEVTGFGAVIEKGLGTSFFDASKSMEITHESGVFSLISFEIDRRSDVSNIFTLAGYFEGELVWESGLYDYTDSQGQGALVVGQFDTPEFDLFRINGVGPATFEEAIDNAALFEEITFDLNRDPSVPSPTPVPLPAGFVLLATALGVLGIRRRPS
ncbi:hypothetical protein [Dinoroseobacter sp. S76]|uniref:hypothetical protein n=1 Tax=Dinoroseobacter sp. S76 TaxID=3415124 RepID=UPI003C7AD571